MSNLEWYLAAIAEDMQKLEDGMFTGNIEFKVNYKDGEICNINIGLNKSIKKLEHSNITT